MNADLFGQWVETNRAAWVPVVRWQEVTAETTQKAVAQGLAVAQDYVEFGTRNAQLLGEVKDPSRWALEQGKLASEFGQKMVSRTADYLKFALETQDAFGQITETLAKTAAGTNNGGDNKTTL